MDSLQQQSVDNKKANNLVLVIGATNRPDSLDTALRRAGKRPFMCAYKVIRKLFYR
jgi:SpoVK/Ycf46/Vps4 family AAA+-type ATPase